VPAKVTERETRWIGTVPTAWQVIRLSACCHIVAGFPFDAEKFSSVKGHPLVRIRDLKGGPIQTYFDGPWVPNAAIVDGDLLVGMDGDFNARIWQGGPALLNQRLARLRGRFGFDLRFVALAAQPAIDEINDETNATTVKHLSMGQIRKAVIPIPSIGEQHRIFAWVDLQTARIDKRRDLLVKKRDLLEDLKRSVIEEATFRGIAKGVVMRDSEIVWLGHVPSHWSTVRVGSLFREASDAGIDGLPMLSVSIHSGISDKELDDNEMERKVSRSEDRTLYKRVKPGDLVYNQMRAWQGAFGAAKIEGLVSPAYVVARPGRAVVPRFIEYLLRAPAAMEEIRRRSRGITDFRLRLYWNEFKNIRIALPPLAEQSQIAAFLDRKLSQINRQIDLIDQLDDLLKQQRKALIYEAVTGKIDLSTYEPPAKAQTA
jgi:type I restriction enzyme S subunit